MDEQERLRQHYQPSQYDPNPFAPPTASEGFDGIHAAPPPPYPGPSGQASFSPYQPYPAPPFPVEPPMKAGKSGENGSEWGGGGGAGGSREYEGKWQDVWAGIVFILHVLLIAGVAIALGKKGIERSKEDVPAGAPAADSHKDFEMSRWLPALVLSALGGGVFSFLWLSLMRMFPRPLIKITLWGSVVYLLVVACMFFASGVNSRLVGILFLVLAGFQAFYAYLVRHRIPFAGAILSQVVSVIGRFPGTVVVSYCALLVSAAWLMLWIFGAAGATSQTNAGVIVFLLLLSLFWTMEVIRNIVHVTVSGTVATYYFQQNNMPPNPTRRSLYRACGKSFGSICLGSLLVAIIQAVRALIQNARSNGDNGIIICCLDCLLACLENIIQYINKYAYVQVAMYGKGFIRAAKDTWDLFKSAGIEVLLNDDLTSRVLFFGCVTGGLVSALIGGIYSIAMHNNHQALAVAGIAFVIGFYMTYLTMVVVESGIASYWVCYAEDPIALQRNDPEFYQELTTRHQQLQAGP